MYPSGIASTYDPVEEGFNPLGYMVPEAHKRNIQVHAWFVVGPAGLEPPSPLVTHPEWGLYGPDGQASGWLNFVRPDVRQYISDLMMEAVVRYRVDGLHFDYTRYPGPEWGFDPYSANLLQEALGLDLDELRYASLPAYGTFKGNPLIFPESAQVLASFDSGRPAVTLNSYGTGTALLLNWDADKRRVALGSELLKRSYHSLRGEGGELYVLNSTTNAQRYGTGDLERMQSWLDDLGLPYKLAEENDISSLPPESVLFLPNVYLISDQTSVDLAKYVYQGGGLVLVDGPTPSIHRRALQAVTGMRGRGRHFEEETLILPEAEHPILPISGRDSDLQEYRRKDMLWKAFRKQAISTMIKDIYQRVKAFDSDVLISVTVSGNQDHAEQDVLQDWPAWLSGGYIDQLIPRLYVDQHSELKPLLDDWASTLHEDGITTLGLIVYTGENRAKIPKPPQQLQQEIDTILAAGSRGLMIFDLDSMSEHQLNSLSGILQELRQGDSDHATP